VRSRTSRIIDIPVPYPLFAFGGLLLEKLAAPTAERSGERSGKRKESFVIGLVQGSTDA